MKLMNNQTGDATKSIYDEIEQINANIMIIDNDILKLENLLAQDNHNIAESLRERNRQHLTRQLSMARKTLENLINVRDDAIWKAKVIERIGGIPETPAQLIEHYISNNGIEILLNNFLGKCNDPTIEAIDGIRVRLQILNDELCLGFKERIIGYAFDEYLINNSIKRREFLRQLVKYDGDIRADVWQKLISTCFTSDDPVDYYAAVVKKFIWQVKRKMVGMPVFDHIMPVLFGAQGRGKTQFIQHFIEPINENVSYPNLKEITDSRNRQLWKRWVLIVDEMEGYERADVDALKNVITKTLVSGRVMNTHNDFNEVNSASLIGASNKTLDELIKDSTGMRRFIQLNWADLDEPGWAIVNGIDYLGLWKSVDETADDPLKPFKEYTRLKQEEFRQKTIVEQWTVDDQRDYGLDLEKRWNGWKGSSLLYVENFLPWYRNRFGSGAVTQTRFGKEIKKLENRLVDCRRTGSAIKYRLVSSEPADIFQEEEGLSKCAKVFSNSDVIARLRSRC